MRKKGALLVPHTQSNTLMDKARYAIHITRSFWSSISTGRRAGHGLPNLSVMTSFAVEERGYLEGTIGWSGLQKQLPLNKIVSIVSYVCSSDLLIEFLHFRTKGAIRHSLENPTIHRHSFFWLVFLPWPRLGVTWRINYHNYVPGLWSKIQARDLISL